MPKYTHLALSIVVSLAACAEPGSDRDAARLLRDAPDPQLLFWDALEALCGSAFEGRITEPASNIDASAEGTPVVHVHGCDTGVVLLALHLGEDRSRVLVVTSTAVGLRLEHERRDRDGSELEGSGYGGETLGRGEETVQVFHADPWTSRTAPERASDIWTLIVEPGERMVYAVRRGGAETIFRAEFDLSRSVTVPPPPPVG